MPSVKKLFLLIIALSAQQFALFSQFNQTEIFTLNDGLAMTECGLAFCDRSGKIWINHSTGWISVYDGYSFTRYSPQETGAYLDGAQFVEDQKGLWIRKEKTVSLFSNDKWKYFDAPSVWNIAVDRKSDTMVLLDKFGGLWRLNAEGDKLIPFSKLPLKEAGQEYTLIPSRLHQSYLLLITKSGIPFSNHKAFVSNSLLHPNWIETPHLVTPGLDWAFQFTSTDQLSHLKVQFPKSNPLKINTNISVARNDLLYTQIFPNALDNDFIIETYKIDSSNSFQFMARYKSGHENVSVTMDLSGNLWIASHSGLSRVNPSIIQCMDDMAQMIPSLHAINEDEQGRIWFGG